jgi:hypothetical protein
MRYAIPALADQERSALADALEVVGRYGEAAELWDLEASRRQGEASLTAASRSRTAQAHLN